MHRWFFRFGYHLICQLKDFDQNPNFGDFMFVNFEKSQKIQVCYKNHDLYIKILLLLSSF